MILVYAYVAYWIYTFKYSTTRDELFERFAISLAGGIWLGLNNFDDPIAAVAILLFLVDMGSYIGMMVNCDPRIFNGGKA
jgi:hypothetical protein